MSKYTLYHNPKCGTSRNVLEHLKNANVDLTVIEYLKTPPSREQLKELLSLLKMPATELLRTKGTPFQEMGLEGKQLTETEILDLMESNPIFINRPIVVSPLGVKLCRPSETVLTLIP